LDPVDAPAAEAAGLAYNGFGLHECVLTGAIPCSVDTTAGTIRSEVRFRLDLNSLASQSVAAPRNLALDIQHESGTTEVVDDWFEDGLLRLNAAMPDGSTLRCCVTCLHSDYSPGGHGLIGIRCHRDAKEQYLAVRSKVDYWSVPTTEDVPETNLCEQYQLRIAGTGYRG
jgi:hypothetical protein